MRVYSKHSYLCVGIVGMNKNAYKVRIVWLSKYQKIWESNAQDRSTLLSLLCSSSLFSGSLCICCRFVVLKFPFWQCNPVTEGQAALHVEKMLRNCFVLCSDLGVLGMTLIGSHKFHGNKVIPCSASNIALSVLVRDVGIQVVTVKIGSKLCEVFFLEH